MHCVFVKSHPVSLYIVRFFGCTNWGDLGRTICVEFDKTHLHCCFFSFGLFVKKSLDSLSVFRFSTNKFVRVVELLERHLTNAHLLSQVPRRSACEHSCVLSGTAHNKVATRPGKGWMKRAWHEVLGLSLIKAKSHPHQVYFGDKK